MTGMDSNCCRIVEKSLSGERAVDERTFASLAILTERLERLKKLGGNFSSVSFSSSVKQLKRRESTLSVC